MKIFVLFREYEIIDLVTESSEVAVSKLAYYGNLHPGDCIEVWENNERVQDFYGSGGYARFMEEYGGTVNGIQ